LGVSVLSNFEDNRKARADAMVARVETAESFLARLDAEDNELDVRQFLATGKYNSRNSALAEEWLRRKEDARASAAAARAEAREDESISIAKRALAIASDARDSATAQARWAMWAAIIATAAAVIATKEQIVALVISWLP